MLDAVGPTELDAFRFAFAAVLASIKNTPAAQRRCRSRMSRAVEQLALEIADEQLARLAVGTIRLGCDACGKCPGVAGIRPPDHAAAA